MFETLSRRSRSLVDQQLSLIDRLERNEEDPDRLDSLFRLDHLAARMRRNGANLLVLAGAQVPREQSEPVPVSAIINAAASEVEDYTRIVTANVPDSEIIGVVAGDLVHLLAELLDNALRYSPPISQVRVSAVHTGNGGLVIEVSDIGLGMAESDLRVANTRLQSGGEVNPSPRGTWVFSWSAASRRSTGWWCGCAAPLRENRIRAPPRVSRARRAAGRRRRDRPVRRPGVRHAGRRPRRDRDGASARRGPRGLRRRPSCRARSISTATRSCRSRCCRSAIRAPAGSRTFRHRWPRLRPSNQTSGPLKSTGLSTGCRRRRRTAESEHQRAADRHLRVLRVPRPCGQQRCAEPATGRRAAAAGATGRARAGPPRGARAVADGRIGRRHLPEDAVRMARRST